MRIIWQHGWLIRWKPLLDCLTVWLMQMMPAVVSALSFRPGLPVLYPVSPLMRLNHACFPSITRLGPVLTVTVLVYRLISKLSWWCLIRACPCVRALWLLGRNQPLNITSRLWKAWPKPLAFRWMCRLKSWIFRFSMFCSMAAAIRLLR